MGCNLSDDYFVHIKMAVNCVKEDLSNVVQNGTREAGKSHRKNKKYRNQIVTDIINLLNQAYPVHMVSYYNYFLITHFFIIIYYF